MTNLSTSEVLEKFAQRLNTRSISIVELEDELAQTLLKLERAKEALREIKKNIHVDISREGHSVDGIEINETREKLVEKYGFHATFPRLDEFIDFILSYIEERKE